MRSLGLCVILLAVLALAGTVRAEPALDPEEHALWTLINDHRQAHELQPVGLNENLMAAAEWMSEDMAAKDYFSHTDSLGRDLRQRLTDFGYKHMAGENLIRGMASAQAVLDKMKGSPEHNDTMLHSHLCAIGIARVHDEAYGWYWTVDFGGRGPAWFPTESTLTLTSVPVAIPAPAPVPAELPRTGTDPRGRR